VTEVEDRGALVGPARPLHPDAGLVDALGGDGEAVARHAAMAQLHVMLLRAARHQVWRMRGMLPGAGPGQLEELAQQSADEAMVSVLAKLPTFEGRSRFSTWVYKFAILQTSVEVRRQSWRGREVSLPDGAVVRDRSPSVEEWSEAADVGRAVRAAIATALTPHQRRILLAVVVEEVPIDVLAERLGTNRNALYKTVHDARARLREVLVATGYSATDDGRWTQ
jgi:RNA polymerase sigma-70 factor, ECF subfamily